MERIFKCFCGRVFLGIERDFDQHLKLDCEVYARAKDTLEKREEDLISGKEN